MLQSNIVEIDTRKITDWKSFHDVFDKAFKFPNFYGCNMNAWIDCMTSLDAPEDGLTEVHAPNGGILVIQLLNVKDFRQRCPDEYNALIECSAFVNYRRIKVGESPIISLSFYG